jgi:hypothetical protein
MNTPTINTDRLTRTDTREFVGELSDLPREDEVAIFQLGMVKLVHAVTGRERILVRTNLERNDDEILWIDFAAPDGVTLRLYND